SAPFTRIRRCPKLSERPRTPPMARRSMHKKAHLMTNVVMPQMGESIAEGTIVRWIKKVGDAIDRDEPLFEISTDKVDAEIPSPAAGVLTEIKVQEGETVAVNSIVATIGNAGDAVAASPASSTLPEAA